MIAKITSFRLDPLGERFRVVAEQPARYPGGRPRSEFPGALGLDPNRPGWRWGCFSTIIDRGCDGRVEFARSDETGKLIDISTSAVPDTMEHFKFLVDPAGSFHLVQLSAPPTPPTDAEQSACIDRQFKLRREAEKKNRDELVLATINRLPRETQVVLATEDGGFLAEIVFPTEGLLHRPMIRAALGYHGDTHPPADDRSQKGVRRWEDIGGVSDDGSIWWRDQGRDASRYASLVEAAKKTVEAK